MPASSTAPAFPHDLGPLIVRPSPNCIEKKFYDVEAADGPGCLARTFLSNNPEAEAWATLFAAAPELASAGSALIALLGELVDGGCIEMDGELAERVEALRAAINKGLGDAS